MTISSIEKEFDKEFDEVQAYTTTAKFKQCPKCLGYYSELYLVKHKCPFWMVILRKLNKK